MKEHFATISTVDNIGDHDEVAKKEFVSLEVWDETKDGPLDMTKVVEETIFNKKVEGCWRTVGREGVFSRTTVSNKLLQSCTEESDGVGPFADKRAERIKEVFLAGRDAVAKKVCFHCRVL